MPRKKVTKASKKVKKVKQLAQTHGKLDGESVPSTLDQIWGDTGLTKYKTMDVEKYEEQLGEFNKTDLQAHATKIGLIPVDNTIELKKRLVREFKKHVSKYQATAQKPRDHKALNTEALKILSEGK
tara:strand:- start:2390 stop:2767 length:378 start_codon:yes stop_codon:yes gene_type:complete